MPFWKKGRKDEVRSEPPARYSASPSPKSDGAFAAFRAETRVPMKVWLPEPVDTALKHLTDVSKQSRSDYIREMLFIYAYGRYTFEQMKAQADGFFYVNQSDTGILFSRSSNRAPALGKNSINYKVWLPAKLRDDLSALASEAGITLSHFVREALISALLGHRTLPERTTALRAAQDTPEDWPPEDDDGKE